MLVWIHYPIWGFKIYNKIVVSNKVSYIIIYVGLCKNKKQKTKGKIYVESCAYLIIV